ncbi:hypothetical protein DFH06DRAFT_1135987 [Mycena polygramma]|nr:hypothetical protein DFH06DRAFT_1135987 [Mycena polygramma]
MATPATISSSSGSDDGSGSENEVSNVRPWFKQGDLFTQSANLGCNGFIPTTVAGSLPTVLKYLIEDEYFGPFFWRNADGTIETRQKVWFKLPDANDKNKNSVTTNNLCVSGSDKGSRTDDLVPPARGPGQWFALRAVLAMPCEQTVFQRTKCFILRPCRSNPALARPHSNTTKVFCAARHSNPAFGVHLGTQNTGTPRRVSTTQDYKTWNGAGHIYWMQEYTLLEGYQFHNTSREFLNRPARVAQLNVRFTPNVTGILALEFGEGSGAVKPSKEDWFGWVKESEDLERKSNRSVKEGQDSEANTTDATKTRLGLPSVTVSTVRRHPCHGCRARPVEDSLASSTVRSRHGFCCPRAVKNGRHGRGTGELDSSSKKSDIPADVIRMPYSESKAFLCPVRLKLNAYRRHLPALMAATDGHRMPPTSFPGRFNCAYAFLGRGRGMKQSTSTSTSQTLTSREVQPLPLRRYREVQTLVPLACTSGEVERGFGGKQPHTEC